MFQGFRMTAGERAMFEGMVEVVRAEAVAHLFGHSGGRADLIFGGRQEEHGPLDVFHLDGRFFDGSGVREHGFKGSLQVAHQ